MSRVLKNLGRHRFGGTHVVVVGSLLAAIVIAAFATKGDGKEDKGSKVEKMMIEAHKGKEGVRDAPLEIVHDEVKKDNPDWTLLAKNTEPLAKLGSMIKDNRTYTSDPGPYIAAVKALQAATKDKDLKQARAAVGGLMNSCARCHKWESK